MSITQITAPSALPLTTDDYAAQNNLTDSRLSSEAMPLGTGIILKGSKFIIKGATFIADSDTAITGTTSNYVTFTVSGTTATPSYVADLTGITWSDIYNGYYDASENYVWFDEMKAYILGVITTPKIIYNKIISDITNQVLKTTSDVEFASVDVDGAISGASVDTGNGATEIYDMDQDVKTTDDVTLNSVTTDNVAIKHKLLTGTVSTGGSATITHGLDVEKIVSIQGLVYHNSGYYVMLSSDDDNLQVRLYSSTITISTVYADYFSQPFRIIVTYQA